jgi:hypothetical protein
MTSDPILRESLSFRLMDGSLGEEFLQMVRARLVDDYPRQVRACLQLLDEEDVWWRPNDHANAVGNLVLHVSGSNRFYLEHVIAGGPDVRNRTLNLRPAERSQSARSSTCGPTPSVSCSA